MDLIKLFEEEFAKKIINLITKYAERKYSKTQKRKEWVQAIDKACRITEGVSLEYVDYFLAYSAINRFYLRLCSGEYDEEIYKEFIVAAAVETKKRDNKIIAFATAILDNWFKSTNQQFLKHREELDINEITNILNSNDMLYLHYFQSYSDCKGPNKIRVYYPKQGKCYLDWDKKASTIVSVNLSNGVEFGFCRVGMDYALINNGNEVMLKGAYVRDDREILRFESLHDFSEEQEIIWAR